MTRTEVENQALSAVVEFRRSYENAMLAYHTGEQDYLYRAEKWAREGLKNLKEEREFKAPNDQLLWQLKASLEMEAAE